MSVGLYFVISIAGSRSGCSCCCCCGVRVALGGIVSVVGMVGVRLTWSPIILRTLNINGVVVAVAEVRNVCMLPVVWVTAVGQFVFCDCHCRFAFGLPLLLWFSGCTWSEGCHEEGNTQSRVNRL